VCRGPNWEDKGGSSSTCGEMANDLANEPVGGVDSTILQNARWIPSPVVSEGIDAFRRRLKVEKVEPSGVDPQIECGSEPIYGMGAEEAFDFCIGMVCECE